MLLFALLPLALATPSHPADPRIRVNSIGFVPDAPKVATIAAPCSSFEVIRVSDGVVVYSGKPASPVQTPKSETDETVQTADFSSVSASGTYAIVVPGVGESHPFRIDRSVWNEPFVVTSRAMYLWRCGTAVSAEWQGKTYAHPACHLDDAWLDFVDGQHVQRKSVGGWHDAGDYNKYPVNAGVSVGLMLKAWEQFGDRISQANAGIPESGNSVPDVLDEVRWEIEWLLTMQASDGRVYHKVSSPDFRYWGPPEGDHDPRYFAPWSTTATADFVAMMAETARNWRRYDAAFADRCLAAAKLSWKCLADHPQPVAADLSHFKTGAYQAKDASHRLWAAVELWEATEDATCLEAFERMAAEFHVTKIGPTWGDVHDLAIATYLLSRHGAGRSPALVARFTEELNAAADAVVNTARQDSYGRPLGGERSSWNWGCNGVVAGQALILQVAHQLKPNAAYRAAAHDGLSFLFGRNFHARSYVTGLGAQPPEHPHDRRGAGWPGYLVGGAWPTGRDWEDSQANYRVNEIAINWNAALIYALAAFVEPPTAAKP